MAGARYAVSRNPGTAPLTCSFYRAMTRSYRVASTGGRRGRPLGESLGERAALRGGSARPWRSWHAASRRPPSRIGEVSPPRALVSAVKPELRKKFRREPPTAQVEGKPPTHRLERSPVHDRPSSDVPLFRSPSRSTKRTWTTTNLSGGADAATGALPNVYGYDCFFDEIVEACRSQGHVDPRKRPTARLSSRRITTRSDGDVGDVLD